MITPHTLGLVCGQQPGIETRAIMLDQVILFPTLDMDRAIMERTITSTGCLVDDGTATR